MNKFLEDDIYNRVSEPMRTRPQAASLDDATLDAIAERVLGRLQRQAPDVNACAAPFGSASVATPQPSAPRIDVQHDVMGELWQDLKDAYSNLTEARKQLRESPDYGDAQMTAAMNLRDRYQHYCESLKRVYNFTN